MPHSLALTGADGCGTFYWHSAMETALSDQVQKLVSSRETVETGPYPLVYSISVIPRNHDVRAALDDLRAVDWQAAVAGVPFRPLYIWRAGWFRACRPLTNVQSARTGYQIARGLMNADSAYSQAELKFRVAELAGTLMDAQSALLAAREEIQELPAEVARLKSVNAPDQKPIKRGNKYFIPGPSGEEGPFVSAGIQPSG